MDDTELTTSPSNGNLGDSLDVLDGEGTSEAHDLNSHQSSRTHQTPDEARVPESVAESISRNLAQSLRAHSTRPLSADAAAQIEGFDDDFQVVSTDTAQVDQIDEEEHEELEEEEGPLQEELVEKARIEHQKLMEANETLQRRVRQALDARNKGRAPVRDGSRLDGADARYVAVLKTWHDMCERVEGEQQHYHSSIFDMKAALEERLKRADDISNAYHHFKLQVANAAEHSKSGKAIAPRLLQQLHDLECEREEEVQRVRLKNLHLTGQLRTLEQKIKEREELADGLHLIDFEQLKIENQSLNEKIEERNEELLKLRKKTTTTVQILTHIKEKLQFMEKENAKLGEELQELEGALSSKREQLASVKTQRDRLRIQTHALKDASVYITNSALLTDIQRQSGQCEEVKDHVEELRGRYYNATSRIQAAGQKIMASVTSQQLTGSQLTSAGVTRVNSSIMSASAAHRVSSLAKGSLPPL